MSLQSTSSVKKAYFDAPDGQIHFRKLLSTAEIKRNPVIFLHMSASDGGHFEPMMDVFAARGHDCFAPDMPG